MDWFKVDKRGLAQILERKGKAFILFELVQNAWDEDTARVDITLERIPGTRHVRLVVEDDNPEGFADLSHAFTLFAQSAKKTDATKRGRFNLGEKLVLAVCEEASIASTRGTVHFDRSGRRASRARRARGSCFTARLGMTDAQMRECEEQVRLLLPPPGIETRYNGKLLEPRQPLAVSQATLPTEVANGDGHIRRTRRKTEIQWFEPVPGTPAMLYEMGIPVVETEDRWSVNVCQKVPLAFDRDNVPPSYLSRIRAVTLDLMASRLGVEDANAAWARQAVQAHGEDLDVATIRRLVGLRFGDRPVAYDPSDLEANSRAVAAGHTLVHGSQMSRAEWAAARRADALKPAGQVTPSPRPYSKDGQPLNLVARSAWTQAMEQVVAYVQRIAPRLLDESVAPEVQIVSDPHWAFLATYGPGQLTLNLGRLGHKWFEGPIERINELLIHELGHHFEANHLSQGYHDALTRLGARLASLALEDPELFSRSARPVPQAA